MEAFQELLEGTSGLKSATTYRKVEEQLGDQDAFRALEGPLKLDVWHDTLKGLTAQEEAARAAAEAQKRRLERKSALPPNSTCLSCRCSLGHMVPP